MSSAPVRKPCLPEEQLRDYFNRIGYADMAARGELIEDILRDGHPTSPLASEPHCTRSQMIAYWTFDRQMVAIVHQYLRPDGTIGLSGKPDPRRVKVGDVVYHRCE